MNNNSSQQKDSFSFIEGNRKKKAQSSTALTSPYKRSLNPPAGQSTNMLRGTNINVVQEASSFPQIEEDQREDFFQEEFKFLNKKDYKQALEGMQYNSSSSI